MKVQVLTVMMASLLALTACSKHEHVHAVDKIEEAQEAALAKAPEAEAVQFEDHGQPTFAETSGATTADATADTATADATQTAESTDTATDAAATDGADTTEATTEENK